MKFFCLTFIMTISVFAKEADFLKRMTSLIEASCIDCHDEETDTRLNFKELGTDLAHLPTFRKWVHIFDRADSGEMPPKKKKRPDPSLLSPALSSLKKALLTTNLESRKVNGRVPVRRLTRLEYEYALQDLLQIKTPLQHLLPAENSAGFDTVSEKQGISPLHIRRYMTAAKDALESAIHKGRRPTRKYLIDYKNNRSINFYINQPWSNGGDSLKKVSDAIVAFHGSDFIYRSDKNGFIAKKAGQYKVTANVYAYQARSPVTIMMYKARGQLSQPRMIDSYDIQPGKTRIITFTTYFDEGEYLLPSFMNMLPQKDGKGIYSVGKFPASQIGRAKIYKGEGIAIRKINVEGPIYESWPPISSQALLPGKKTVADIIRQIGSKALRRPLKQEEFKYYYSIAEKVLLQKKPAAEAVITSLTALLSSPQFLFLNEESNKDYSLASRLSFFLWKSLPDERLLSLAAKRELSKPSVLRNEVERMINDLKFQRFMKDFTGQWLRVYDIDATTPDKKIYREYDDLLRQSMIDECELFFSELIKENLSTLKLINADFTFANKRLARHYQLPPISSQKMRKVKLPQNSVRGGILSQAVVHKVTANGTVTSPVRRGNFILNNLLGKPVPPPPPNAGSIEPDIRGKKGIKEILKAHRDTPDCIKCHNRIDPPGFALESFDVIGGFRTKYRNQFGKNKGTVNVDASGITPDGSPFNNFADYKKLMLKSEQKSGLLTRQLIRQLIVYGTGGEIQFADREEVEKIFEEVKKKGFGVRDIFHTVIQSSLFRNK